MKVVCTESPAQCTLTSGGVRLIDIFCLDIDTMLKLFATGSLCFDYPVRLCKILLGEHSEIVLGSIFLA